MPPQRPNAYLPLTPISICWPWFPAGPYTRTPIRTPSAPQEISKTTAKKKPKNNPRSTLPPTPKKKMIFNDSCVKGNMF